MDYGVTATAPGHADVGVPMIEQAAEAGVACDAAPVERARARRLRLALVVLHHEVGASPPYRKRNRNR